MELYQHFSHLTFEMSFIIYVETIEFAQYELILTSIGNDIILFRMKDYIFQTFKNN